MTKTALERAKIGKSKSIPRRRTSPATTYRAFRDYLARLPRPVAWGCGFVAVWLAIVAWRWEIIASPPYWDSAMGLFLEADFLARTHFDYRRLFFDERRFIEGGSGIYLISLMPTLLAVAMACLPNTLSVLVAGHLFSFAVAALLVLIFFAALRTRVAWDEAVLVCVALATTPLFATQIDMIGMDLPMTAAAALSLWFLIRERYIATTIASLLAFFLKISGGITTGATIIYLAVLLLISLSSPAPVARRRYWAGLGVALIGLSIELFAVDWSIGLPKSGVEQMEADLELGFSSLAEARNWCPELVSLFFVTLVAYLLVTAGELVARYKKHHGLSIARRLRLTLENSLSADRHLVFTWAVILGTLAVLSRIYTIPRYLTLPLVFLWFNIALLLFNKLRLRRAGLAFVAGMLAFNLLNASGKFYPPATALDRYDGRTGAFLERSREYLADHRANLEAIKVINQLDPSRAIVAPNPFVHFLSVPSLGYVDEPRHGYAVNTFSNEAFRPVAALHDAPPQDLVFVWIENRFTPLAECSLPKPSPEDRFFYRSGSPVSLAVFEKNFAPIADPIQRKRQYLSLLWPGDDLIQAAEQLAAAGKVEEAINTYRRIIASEPMRYAAHARLAELLVSRRDYDAALAEYQFLIEQTSHDLVIHKAMAKLLIETNRLPEAENHLKKATLLDPNDFEAYQSLGLIAARTGNYARAERCFRQVVRCQPGEGIGYAALGDLFAATGRQAEALANYRQAIELSPDMYGVMNVMAWLLATASAPGLRNGVEAVQLAERLCNAVANRPAYLDTLAAAYAESGEYEKAIATGTIARELAIKSGQSALSRDINARIDEYRNHHPHREPPVSP